ncbi:MAG: T9SS type A sorting domain-containing protein [bacterium]|nr:T9SS type A sorting domain-containing protein [bacterium]
MKTKIIFLIFFPLFINLQIFAQNVDLETAKKVAKNYWYEKVNSKEKTSYSSVNVEHAYTEQGKSSPAYYVFNIESKKGFVIVSAEESVNPVLGYSFESNYNKNEEKPPAFVGWMNHYTEQINYAKSLKNKPRKEIEILWEKYSKKNLLNTKSKSKSVSPLLTTKWNQGNYYNDSCPPDPAGSGGNVWVGCVAVAMAQVMKYWNYPEKGSGEKTYTHYKYGVQSADFKNTTYGWGNMSNSLNSSSTTEEIAATAQLLYHCGVGVSMGYGTSGSGAFSSSALRALQIYFDYSEDADFERKNSHTDSSWNALLRYEIDNGRPLYYSGYPSSGSGHAFNCDGYNDSNEFHFNWGWGGSYNGYFLTDDLTPGSRNYNYSQQIFANLYPNCNKPTCEGTTVLSEPSGTIKDGSPEIGIFTNYSNCSNCKWLIQPDDVHQINLSFKEFSTVKGEDSLYVYDGPDSTYPVLLALSGDTIPNDILSTGDEVFIHFKSNEYTTAPGWKIEYTCSFDDAGVIQMLKPVDATCGNSNDSIIVIVKNFGINSQSSLPITVDVNTPSGLQIYKTIYSNVLAMNEQDTVFVSEIDRTDPGDYTFNAYTELINDTIINSNDTLNSVIKIKIPHELPYFDNISGDYSNFNWIDRNYATFQDMKPDGSFHLRAYIGKWGSQFVYLDNKIKAITRNTKLKFDYRIYDNTGHVWPPNDSLVLNSNEKIHIIASTDCGNSFDTVYTINHTNHIATTKFVQFEVSLSDYNTKDILIGFASEWDTINAIIDYDNILISNELNGSSVTNDQTICLGDTAKEIEGNIPFGGVGEIQYLWEESTNGIVWDTASELYSNINYLPGKLNNKTYFRRIATDTIGSSDTSNIVTVFVSEMPTVDLGEDISNCESEVSLFDKSGESHHKYLWSTGEETQSVYAYYSGEYWLKASNAALCSQTDTINVKLNKPPIPNLGNDKEACNAVILRDINNNAYNSYLWSTGDNLAEINITESGQYILTVEDSNNCEGSDTINLIVKKSSLKPKLGNDTTVCGSIELKNYSGISYDSYSWITGETSESITVSESGEYILEVSGSDECPGVDTINVQINTLPDINLGNDTTIFNNETLIIISNKTFNEYLWNDGSSNNTLLINGADFVPDVYSFSLKIKDDNGCSSADTINVTVEQYVLVYGDELNNILIYPNPFVNKLKVNILELEGVRAEIIDSNGRVIKTYAFDEETKEIDFPHYPAGIYYVRFELNNKVKTFKIIKL